jgi:hypothetical protein
VTGARRSRRLPARARVSILVGVVLFLVLAGTGVATASWTASGAIGVSASAGSLSFTQSGASALDGYVYKSNFSVVSGTITVTNTGTVPSPFTLTVKAVAQTGLSDAVVPAGWFVTDPGNCAATPPTAAVTTAPSLTNGIVLKGASLAPQASVYLCVTTEMVIAVRKGSASVNVTLAPQQLGTWGSQSTVLFGQSSN